MKKLLLIAMLGLFVNVANAQTVTPRYGITKNNDNTGRVLTWTSNTITPTSTLVTVAPNAYQSLITIASTSISPTFTANLKRSYLSDRINLLVTPNSTGTRTLTFGTGSFIGTATTMTVAASKQALVTFIFDGAKYMEISRSVQP
jgi:hypothetical protein